jgi:phosphoenolpyruvate---glycerone phosphotransferase subunit DhaM
MPGIDRPEDRMVGIVLVSHSRTLAEGLAQMLAQVSGGDVPVAIAAGTPDGRLGTSAPLITDAIRSVDGPDGVLVLLDLGSAALSVEVALEDLTPDERARVQVSGAPIVEGAVVAAVQASTGSPLEVVAREAAAAVSLAKLPEPLTGSPVGID